MLASLRIPVSAALALAVCLLPSSAARAQDSQSAHGLVGAWSVSVTLTDCNGTVKGTFPSLVMFSRGGTVTETTFNPAFQPGQRGTGLGVWWHRDDDDAYGAIDVAFIQYTAGPFTAGTQEITHQITLNDGASEWTDTATVQFYDLAHNPLAHACATAKAVRLH